MCIRDWNWEDTKKALEQSAEEVLGNNLEAIDFYTKQGNGESTIYVVEDVYKRQASDRAAVRCKMPGFLRLGALYQSQIL